jgi:hypothetical protein
MNLGTGGVPAAPFALSLSKPPASSLADEEGGSSTGSSERIGAANSRLDGVGLLREAARAATFNFQRKDATTLRGSAFQRL